jgi:hypothetical protein
MAKPEGRVRRYRTARDVTPHPPALRAVDLSLWER